MTKIDQNLSDTEFVKIPHLEDGADLDALRRVGHFAARDPQGLAAGEYFITNYVSNISGQRRTVQIAENVLTGTQQFRAKNDTAWTAWATRAAGGVSATNLSVGATSTTVVVSSDTGTDATLTVASETTAGVMGAADKTKLNAIEAGATADQTGAEIVSAIDAELGSTDWQTAGGTGATNLGATTGSSTVTITSDTGTDATILAATGSAAGVMTAADKSKLDGVQAGATDDQTGSEIVSAIDTQLGGTGWRGSGSTNLGYTADSDSVQITSDTGSDVDILAATGSTAGVMSAATKTEHDALYALIGNIPDSPSRVFNVLDYGALPDGGSAAAATNRTAFENAILAAEAAGGGQIYAPRGTYYISYGGTASVGGVRLRSNMHLVGDGMGITTIKAADIGNNDMAGLVRTQSGIENTNIVVRDLTIDGNKGEQTGWANIICFFAGVTPDDRVHMDRDIWCINVECKNGKNGTTGSSNLTRGYGFDPHEVVDRFVALNCVAHDCERDGFVLDGVLNFQLIGCKSWNSGRHNFNFITTTFNGEVVGCHAWNSGQLGTGNNFTVQNNSSHITFVGCRSRGALENGFRIRSGDVIFDTFVKMIGCHIQESGKNGLQLTGASYNTIEGCTFENNSQTSNDTYFDVALDEDDGDSGTFRGASYNRIQGNLCVRTDTFLNGVTAAKAAYRENESASVLPNNNYFAWNEAYGPYTQGKYYNVFGDTVIRDKGYLDFFNAKDHGVYGDGVTDDGPALRALIDTVEARGGGTIYLPPGNYLISRNVSASQGCLALPGGVNLLGSGMDTTTLTVIDPGSDSITGVVRTLSGGITQSTIIENFAIVIPTASGSGDITGIYVGGSTDHSTRIRNVLIYDPRSGTANAGYGIRMTNSSDHAVLEDVYIARADRDGIYIDAADFITLRNCYVESSGRHGINISGATFVDLIGCGVTGSGTNGIIIQDDSYNVNIVGGHVTASTEDGIRIRRGASVYITEVSLNGVRIHNNGRDGVSTAGAWRNRISNCSFYDNGNGANSTYNDVSLEKDATYTATLSEYNIVSACGMFATQANKTKYAISEASTAGDNNRFVGNYGTGQVTAFYNIVGASTKKLDYDTAPAAGSLGYFQYYATGGVLGGAAGLTYDTANNRAIAANPLQVNDSSNTTGVVGAWLAQGDTQGSITFPTWMNSVNDETRLSRGFPGNMSYASAANIGATTPVVYGCSLTASTGTGRSFASTNKLTSARRIGYDTGTTPGTIMSIIATSANYCWRGNGTGLGGFFYEFLIGFPGGFSNDSKFFFGLAGTTTSLVTSGAAINATANYIGIAKTTGDSAFNLIGNDNSGTGAALYTFGTSVADISGSTPRLFRVWFYAPSDSSSIYFNITEAITGTTEGGAVTGANLPSSGSMMSPHMTLTNGGDAANNQWDFIGMYLENRGL